MNRGDFGDCHIHMILDGDDFREAIALHCGGDSADDVIRSRLKAYRDAGVTFLRDGGDAFGVCGRAKELAADYGIDYRSPAFPIYKEGHYGAFIGKGFKNMDEYKALVRQAKTEKADFIKLMISGIMDFNNYGVLVDGTQQGYVLHKCESGYVKRKTFTGGLATDEISEMIEVAHDEGFAVMAHCNGAENICAALSAGVDTIEHGAYMDDKCLELLAESDTVWVPTVTPIANLIGAERFDDTVLKKIANTHIENINRAWSLGAMVALGTDAGAYHVPHVKSVKSEYTFIKEAINDHELDTHLTISKEQISWRFKR